MLIIVESKKKHEWRITPYYGGGDRLYSISICLWYIGITVEFGKYHIKYLREKLNLALHGKADCQDDIE